MNSNQRRANRRLDFAVRELKAAQTEMAATVHPLGPALPALGPASEAVPFGWETRWIPPSGTSAGRFVFRDGTQVVVVRVRWDRRTARAVATTRALSRGDDPANPLRWEVTSVPMPVLVAFYEGLLLPLMEP